MSSSVRSVIKHLGLAITFHTGRLCRGGSRDGRQGMDMQELQENKEEEEGSMEPFLFGRGIFCLPAGNLCGDVWLMWGGLSAGMKSSAPLCSVSSATYHHCSSLQSKASVAF